MMIIDEPIRGSIPPPWFWSLPGLERIQAVSQGLVPLPPICRLTGIRVSHVGPGFATCLMPASAWNQGTGGMIDCNILAEFALTGAATTTLAPATRAVPLTLSVHWFRPGRPLPGNIIARARVNNVNSFFVFVEAEIEDPAGRQLGHASSQIAIRPVTPAPPPPPATLRPVDEPAYPTPDPYLRPVVSRLPPPDLWDCETGAEIMRGFVNGVWKSPAALISGTDFQSIAPDKTVATSVASEWLSGFSREVTQGVLAAIAGDIGTAAVFTCMTPGHSFAAINQASYFHYPVLPDGRAFHIEGAIVTPAPFPVCEVHIVDADGTRAATIVESAAFIDNSQRQARHREEPRRVLATLLFTDIVGSTDHAHRLGDARWRILLDRHHAAIRDLIPRFDGTEIDTVGDGFFVRFDSPARALQCARAAREGVSRLGLEIRAGVHTGECEIHGTDLAGMAVHLAARVCAAAAPGEILASSTVKDLATGSGLHFTDRGPHNLKGIPEPCRLFALTD